MIRMKGPLFYPLFILATFISNVRCRHESPKVNNHEGEPFILTPLLEQGNIKEAKERSSVPENVFLGIKSYSGFFTVDKLHNSNTFFWFFPATDADYERVPVIVWLQGGPGTSSLYATFMEIGPFELKDKSHIKIREISWTSNHSIVFIDNPVGTGFSFTNRGWRTKEEEVGHDLYVALTQFFQLFPELQMNDFFVAGESYAGKYVPALSYVIHNQNMLAKLKINLRGLLIGNGVSDTVNQLNYGHYLYQIGLIDFNERGMFKSYENQIVSLIKEEKYGEASILFDNMVMGLVTPYPTLFENITGFSYIYNYLQANGSLDYSFADFVQQNHIRKALHVGNAPFTNDSTVAKYLRNDTVKSVAPWISKLLSHYRILIYNGQLDIICAYPLTVNYLRNLNFSASDDYKKAKRYEWKVDGEFAGYVKEAGNLTEVLVRNAGHMVPHDQPKRALDLMSKFVRNMPLY